MWKSNLLSAFLQCGPIYVLQGLVMYASSVVYVLVSKVPELKPGEEENFVRLIQDCIEFHILLES